MRPLSDCENVGVFGSGPCDILLHTPLYAIRMPPSLLLIMF